jgi:hypothetical protein
VRNFGAKIIGLGLGVGLYSGWANAQTTPTPEGSPSVVTLSASVDPSSCTLSITPSEVNFGSRLYQSLQDVASGTVLPNPQAMILTIDCGTQSLPVAFGIQDLRDYSVVTGLSATYTSSSGIPTGSSSALSVFGLGQTPSGTSWVNIGIYTVSAENFTVDGSSAFPAIVDKSSGSVVGSVATSGVALNDNQNLAYSWVTAAGGKTFSQGSKYTVQLSVTPTINQRSSLPSTTTINFDGAATVTVYYF